MPVKVDIPYQGVWELDLPRERAFAWFADVEKAIPGHFPGIEKFEKTGELTYHWVFEKLSYGGHHLAIELATKFALTPGVSIAAAPVPGVSDSHLSLKWSFADRDKGCTVRFDARLDLVLPIPGILKGMAAPIAQKEIGKLFERYHGRVAQSIPE